MLLYVIALLLVVYVWYKWKVRKLSRFAEQLPGGRSISPLGDFERLLWAKCGNLAELMNLFDGITEGFGKQGIMRFWMAHLLGVIVWRADLVEAIATNPRTSRKGKLLYYLFGDILEGLVINEGTPDVKEHRRAILQMMKKKHFESRFHPAFLKHSDEFVKRLKSLKEVNALDEVSRFSFELFGDTSIGVGGTEELKEASKVALQYAYTYTGRRFLNLFKIWPFFTPFVHASLDSRKVIKDGFNIVYWCLSHRKKKMEDGDLDDDFEFFTDILLKKGIEHRLSEEDLAKELVEGMLAGGATTSMVLSGLLVFLAIHSDVQEELYQEQLALFGEDLSREPSLGDLQRMERLERAVKEFLRLVPVPFIHKQATDDVQVGEYLIPKDTYLIVNLRQLHRNPDYWERPGQFFPDHFLPERTSRRPEHAFIPFGIGTRRCPGERYALASMTTAASTLIRNFKFSSNVKSSEHLVYEMNFLCGFQREDYTLKIESRHSS